MNLLRIIAIVAEGFLSYDSAAIQSLIHPMYGDTVNLDPVFYSPLYSMSALKCRKQ